MKTLAASVAALLMPLCAFAEGSANAVPKGAPGTGQIVSWLFSTCVIVAIIFVLAYIVKKTRLRVAGGGHCRILSQIQLGPKERAAEIVIAGRHLIVGVTSQQITLLADLGTDGREFAAKLSSQTKALNTDETQKGESDDKR